MEETENRYQDLSTEALLSEKLIGMKVTDLEKLENGFVLDLLGMEERSPRIKCAILGLEAVKRASSGEEDDPCEFC